MPGYIRYVDDFLVFANHKAALWKWLADARRELDKLRLLLNERKTRIYPVEESIPFLGFRVSPHRRRLLPGSVKRARRRLHRLEKDHAAGRHTHALRRCLLASVAFRAGGQSCDSLRQDIPGSRLEPGEAGRSPVHGQRPRVDGDVQTTGPAPARRRARPCLAAGQRRGSPAADPVRGWPPGGIS